MNQGERRKQRYWKDREKELTRGKQYYQDNRLEITERQRQYRKKNKEKIIIYCQKNKEKLAKYQKQYKEMNPESKRKYRKKYRMAWAGILAERGLNKCKKCGYDKYLGAIEQHHLNPSIKKIPIGRLTSCAVTNARLMELDKCIPLCANCHKELHNHIWDIKEIL